MKNAVDAFKGFIDPFAMDEKENLVCISSGAIVSSIFEEDILNAEKKVKKQEITL